jgi:hypothetical protein
MYRRNFDAEIAAKARLEPGKSPPRSMQAPPPDPVPPERLIVITANDKLRDDLVAKGCTISPSGTEWLIEALDRASFEQILGFLKLRGVHGMLRRKRA